MRIGRAYPTINLILFQVSWTAAVAEAGKGRPGISWVLAGAVLAVHFALVTGRRREAAFIVSAAILGSLFDALLIAAGVYAPTSGSFRPWPCPPWIPAVWLIFLTTFRGCFSRLAGRYAAGAFFGIFGGPLTYCAAARLGAVTIDGNKLLATAIFSVSWLLIMPALLAGSAWAARGAGARRA